MVKSVKITFLFLLFSVYSCFPINEGICEKNISCRTDEDCSKKGENFVCYTKYTKTIEGIRKYEPEEYSGDGCVTQKNVCIEDKCSNFDCGELNCILVVDYNFRVRATCDCGENKYYDVFEHKCRDFCKDNSDCSDDFVCNNINECSPECNSDKDCKEDIYTNSYYCNTEKHYCPVEDIY